MTGNFCCRSPAPCSRQKRGPIRKGKRQQGWRWLAQSFSWKTKQRMRARAAIPFKRTFTRAKPERNCSQPNDTSCEPRTQREQYIKGPVDAAVRQTSQSRQRRNPHGIDPDYRFGAVLVRRWRLLGSSSRSLVIDGRVHAMQSRTGQDPRRNCDMEVAGVQTDKMVGARGFEPPTPSLPD
jgi:hypothetical protein